MEYAPTPMIDWVVPPGAPTVDSAGPLFPALCWIGLDWMDWIGLDWIGLDWIGLDWIGLDWIGLVSRIIT